MKSLFAFAFIAFLSLGTQKVQAQDPNFFIFLAFGQSNMEGQGTIESQDKTVDSRFKVLQAVDCSNLNRTQSTWYPAVPPLCRCWNGLSPADYFGRTLVENLPSHIKVGIINVSIGGCRIELFDKDIYQNYTDTYPDDWFQNAIAEYGGNPYGHLIDLAKEAQKVGVIKGILLHQGESNNGDQQWPTKVKKIYTDMVTDLGLEPSETPLLAGELVHADQDGGTAGMNTIIAKLPDVLPNSYVISSSGCTDKTDNIHFNSAGYRELGTRYGTQMLSLLEYDDTPLSATPADMFSGYKLDQNYPNPVKDETAFSFEIPSTSYVSIKLYNMLGREVSDVVSGDFIAGQHAVSYKFDNLPRGIYFYTMRADDFELSRRVILE